MILKCSTSTVKNRRRISLSSKIDNETLHDRWFLYSTDHCDEKYKSLIDPIRDKLNAEMNFANPGVMYQRLNATAKQSKNELEEHFTICHIRQCQE